MKANIDLFGPVSFLARRNAIDQALQRYWTSDDPDPFLARVLPNTPKDAREGFQPDELLPGDLVWFENPYYQLLTPAERAAYKGEAGSNVFYIGDQYVIDLYSRAVIPIHAKQLNMKGWSSVQYAERSQRADPTGWKQRINGLPADQKAGYIALDLFPAYAGAFRILGRRKPVVYAPILSQPGADVFDEYLYDS
jgi:hypothetical protein